MSKDIKYNLLVDTEESVSDIKDVEKAFDKLENKFKEIKTSMKKNLSFTDLVNAANVAVAAISKVSGVFIDLIRRGMDAEQASIRFGFALKNVGLEKSKGELIAYASELSRLGKITTLESMKIISSLSTFGLSKDQLKQTAKDAISLASAYGVPIEEVTKKIAEFRTGNKAALDEILIGSKSITDVKEKELFVALKIAEANELQAKLSTSNASKAKELAILWDSWLTNTGVKLMNWIIEWWGYWDKVGKVFAGVDTTSVKKRDATGRMLRETKSISAPKEQIKLYSSPLDQLKYALSLNKIDSKSRIINYITERNLPKVPYFKYQFPNAKEIADFEKNLSLSKSKFKQASEELREYFGESLFEREANETLEKNIKERSLEFALAKRSLLIAKDNLLKEELAKNDLAKKNKDELTKAQEAYEIEKKLAAQRKITEDNEKDPDYRSPEQRRIISKAKIRRYSSYLEKRTIGEQPELQLQPYYEEVEGLKEPIITRQFKSAAQKMSDDSLETFTNIKNNLTSSFSSAFQIILKDSNDFSDAMKSIFDSLLNSITQSLTDRLATNLVDTLLGMVPGGSIISTLFNFSPAFGNGGGSVAGQLNSIERAIRVMDSNNRDVTAKYQSVFNAQVLTNKQLYKATQDGMLKLQAVT